MIGDKAKLMARVFKMKKEVERLSVSVDENGIEVEAGGFMTMGEPRIKSLVIAGGENKMLTEAINKALKKAAKLSMTKMKELGGDGLV
jgi:DNA-binding protein YbaB